MLTTKDLFNECEFSAPLPSQPVAAFCAGRVTRMYVAVSSRRRITFVISSHVQAYPLPGTHVPRQPCFHRHVEGHHSLRTHTQATWSESYQKTLF